MKTMILVCVSILVSGCATFQSIASRAKPIVERYCAQDLYLRELTRMEVNEAIAPNSIFIGCANDE
jgi:hypothetical protein